LKSLDDKEQKRQQAFVDLIKDTKKKFEDEHFDNASRCLYFIL